MLLRVADLGWQILDFQGPLPFSLFSPAVDSHEFPVCKPFIGKIQQPAIGDVVSGNEGAGTEWLDGGAGTSRALGGPYDLAGPYPQGSGGLAPANPRAKGTVKCDRL